MRAAYALVFLKRSRGRKRAPIHANLAQISLSVFFCKERVFYPSNELMKLIHEPIS